MAPLERTLKALMEIVIGLDGRCRNWPACPPPSTPHTPTRTSPKTLHPARGTHTTTLLHSLANIARAQHDSAATGLEDRE
ncbi:hypothetical protein [Nonomuraea fuscirosea]|uniref:hypothetical protein n=1 Tax=Nonomuraea fuscirosea TaxID=1291556 RepID=UPI00340DD68D